MDVLRIFCGCGAVCAAVMMAGCDQAKTADVGGRDPAALAAANRGTPVLEAKLNGEPWVAVSIRYHVDHAFDAKEYAHTFEARAADGSKLDMTIVSKELTLGPGDYTEATGGEIAVVFTPAGREAGSFSGDVSGDARLQIVSERTATAVAGMFSATLQDLDPSGADLKVDGEFANIPRAKP